MRDLLFCAAVALPLSGLCQGAHCETQDPDSGAPRVVAAGKALPPSAAALKIMARKAAEAHALPPEYFVRLIARESRFDMGAVSRAGAMGISQFMPGTAAARSLSNPFDPAEALPKSAEYLSVLRREFGNLGLAAAAYNAGPARVRRWLAGESRLPLETLHYVLAITDRDAESWAPGGAKLLHGPADPARAGLGRHDISASSPRNWELALLLSLAPANARVIASMRAVPDAQMRPTKPAERRSNTAASLEQRLCSTCIVQAAY